MDEKDPIENRFRSAFSEYEQEPPDRVWEHLHEELHPEPGAGGFWSRLMAFSPFPQMHLGFYLTLGGAGFAIILTIVFLGYGSHRTIRGHAYAGEARLRHGMAVLFRVTDITMPWDSATHYRSALIDEYGHFQFAKVGEGKYILRITPDEHSETAKKFLPSWYDRHKTSDSCNLITIENNDVNTEVHLVLKDEVPY
jgi:hypothetical protein